MAFLLLTRPFETATALAGQLTGHRCLISPVLTYRGIEQTLPDFARYDGLVFTSAAAIHSLRQRCDTLPDLPVYTVGGATADAARQAGFSVTESANGDGISLASLLRQKTGHRRLLHFSGLHTAVDLADALKDTSIALDRHVLYEAEAASDLAPEAIAALRNGDITHIPFFSARTAEIFGTLIRRHQLEDALASVTALCISKAAMHALGDLPFQDRLIAERPDADALLALIDD